MSDKGLEIFEASIEKFQEFVENVTHKLKAQNVKVKSEIDTQIILQEELEKNIEELKAKKALLIEDSKRIVDPRRNVLSLKDFMNCTPDQDIVLV